MADSYERFKNLSKVEQDRVYKWLADKDKEKWDKFKGKIAKQTQANKALAYKRAAELGSQSDRQLKQRVGRKKFDSMSPEKRQLYKEAYKVKPDPVQKATRIPASSPKSQADKELRRKLGWQKFDSLSPEKKEIYKKAYNKTEIKKGIGAKEYKKLITTGTQGLSSASIKWLTRLVGGPIVGTLSYLFDPSPAGEPNELERLRNIEAAGFRPTEAGRKRAVPGASKRGGGKIKKNYSKGGGVRSANY